MNDYMSEEERVLKQKQYLDGRKKVREFGKFLFNKTDLGALDCKGLINTYEIAEQILPYLEKLEEKK